MSSQVYYLFLLALTMSSVGGLVVASILKLLDNIVKVNITIILLVFYLQHTFSGVLWFCGQRADCHLLLAALPGQVPVHALHRPQPSPVIHR